MILDSLFIPFMQLKVYPIEGRNVFKTTAMVLMPHDYSVIAIEESSSIDNSEYDYHIYLQIQEEIGADSIGNNQAFRTFEFSVPNTIDNGFVTVWVHYTDKNKEPRKVKSKMNYQDAELIDVKEKLTVASN